jgi:quinol-cytochrome oxidoreductase complex cytochrome b subunit
VIVVNIVARFILFMMVLSVLGFAGTAAQYPREAIAIGIFIVAAWAVFWCVFRPPRK